MLHPKKMFTGLLTIAAAVSALLACSSCNITVNLLESSAGESVSDAQQTSVGLLFDPHGDGTCAVSGIGTCDDTQLILPEKSPDGDTVTGIAGAAFRDCTQIESVVIPETVTVISASAFRSCPNLQHAALPKSLTAIERDAFAETALTEITIENQVSQLGIAVFQNCKQLSAVTFRTESLQAVPEQMFAGCTQLQQIQLPVSVTEIRSSAFEACTSLTAVQLPEHLVSIGMRAFISCESLRRIVIPASVTSIGDAAFCRNTALEEAELFSGVTRISADVFLDCPNLQTINFHGTLTQWQTRTVNCPLRAHVNCLIEEPAETVTAQTAQTTEPAVTTVVTEPPATDPPQPITQPPVSPPTAQMCYLSISLANEDIDAGSGLGHTFVVYYEDADGDGVITFNDVLIIFHRQNDMPNEYATSTHNGTLCIDKICGVQDGSTYGFAMDDVLYAELLTPIRDNENQTGNRITVYAYKDRTGFSDRYTYFRAIGDDFIFPVSNSELYECHGSQKLQLRQVYYDQNGRLQDQPLPGAVITIDGQRTDYVADANGMVLIYQDVLWDMLPVRPQQDIVTVGFTFSSGYYVPAYFECCYWDWGARLQEIWAQEN